MVKRMHQSTLDEWCYSDGTVFYLDRTQEDVEHTQRQALGPYVWRMADCSDALYGDCVGPSAYHKAQGRPVKMWGFLAASVLYVDVLDEGENMDTLLYVELIEDKFSELMGN